MTDERVRLRAGFDRVAPLYDRIRPTYPAALFDDLAELTGIGPGCRVLEIGCGTGQATEELARRGCNVLAVELGPRLASVAKARLAGTSVRIEIADFDRWDATERNFDVVFAATAFHWLDPTTKFERTAALLRPGGALATVAGIHIAGGTADFFREAQMVYRRYDPNTPPHLTLQPAANIPFDRAMGHCYGAPVFRRHERSIDYRTSEYLDLLRTFSGTLVLAPLVRDGFLAEIGALIDGRYGGQITRRTMVELRVATRQN